MYQVEKIPAMWYAGTAMKCLIIDTSRDPAVLLLSEGEQVLSSQIIEGGKKLSLSFFSALKSLFPKEAIDAIAVGVGPGSFIGIRTGATIAKTLSYAHSIPIVSFPSPIAFIPPTCEKGSFAFIGDAKMGEVYLILGETPEKISLPILLPPNQLHLHLKGIDRIVAERELVPSAIPPTFNPSLIARHCYQLWLKAELISHETLTLSYLR